MDRGEQARAESQKDPAEPDRQTVGFKACDVEAGNDGCGRNCEIHGEDVNAGLGGRGAKDGLIVDREVVWRKAS